MKRSRENIDFDDNSFKRRKISAKDGESLSILSRSNGVTFRGMTVNDITFVHKIDNDSFPDPYDRQVFADNIEDSAFFPYVIEIEEVIIGYCIFRRHKKTEAEIMSVAISKAYRRRGFGEQAMLFVINEASKLGIERVFLLVSGTNTAALKMYEKMGFGIDSIFPKYYVEEEKRVKGAEFEEGVQYSKEDAIKMSKSTK